MRFLFTMQQAVLAGSLLGMPGCGSGDEPEPTAYVSKAPPPDPSSAGCVPAQSSTLALNERTAFGENGLEMLGAVLPGDTMLPFFWVGYDDLDAPVSFLPGVSETLLRVSIWPRDGAVVRQSFTPLAAVPCEPSHIEVPVHVALETADGALAEAFDADVSFEQRDVASLNVELAPDALRGGLALEPAGALATGWQLRALGIHVSLWRGGTSGEVTPLFVKPAPTPEAATPPLRTGPEKSERSREGLGDGPGIPLHWGSLAVWPRRERCATGPAVGIDERRFGWSPRDALAALAERATFSIATDAGETPVRAAFDEPLALVCTGPGMDAGQMSFITPGRLTADDAAAGSPLEGLDLSGAFRISTASALDGSGINELACERWAPDVTAIAESREAFVASTGLVLEVPEHYQLFWWTLAIEQHRTASTEPWQSSGEVSVFGADAFGSVSVGTGAFEGETAPPPMAFQTLEGDVLLHASIGP